ncbi:MAG: hypothetical protein QW660_03475 [Candidatus Bathyarchaeia archaeon]
MPLLHENVLTFEEFLQEPLLPTISSVYLWDMCRTGKLFFPEVYDLSSVKGWIENFLLNAISSVDFPRHFDKRKVVKVFVDKAIEAFNKSEFKKIYDSIDVKDLDSIKDLIKESEEKTERGFQKLVNFLKENDEFPAILWMEVKRFNDVYTDVMQLMFQSMNKWYRYFPKSKSQIISKSRLAKALTGPYDEIASNFMNVFLSFFKLLLFLEIWSCETEDELFTGKPLSFKNVDFVAFEKVFFDFYESLNNLSTSFLRFKRKEKTYDFLDPVGWALKNLMLLPGA